MLADMAKGRLREKLDALEEALEGVMGSHQRLMLGVQLRHLSYLDREVERLDDEVDRRVGPHKDVLQVVDTIPGVGRRTAETIVAEMGTDMDRFATPGAPGLVGRGKSREQPERWQEQAEPCQEG